MRQRQSEELNAVLESVDENFGRAVNELMDTQRENFERITDVTDTNCRQIDQLSAQGTKIETFLDEVVAIIKDNDDKSHKITENLEKFERDFTIYKQEIKDLVSDFENRYSYFHSSVQTDISSIMKAQREANSGIEKFVEMVDQRTGILESNVDEKFTSLSEQVHETKTIAGSGGQVDMDLVNNNLNKFKHDNKRS
jgi:ABC-type transporter Mla subunit MlaD